MTPLANGEFGFAWEEGNMWYNIVFASLPLEAITSDRYSLAFSSGIGSVATPYVVRTAEEYQAYKDLYSDEGVCFSFEDEAKALKDAEEAEITDTDSNQPTESDRSDC